MPASGLIEVDSVLSQAGVSFEVSLPASFSVASAPPTLSVTLLSKFCAAAVISALPSFFLRNLAQNLACHLSNGGSHFFQDTAFPLLRQFQGCQSVFQSFHVINGEILEIWHDMLHFDSFYEVLQVSDVYFGLSVYSRNMKPL